MDAPSPAPPTLQRTHLAEDDTAWLPAHVRATGALQHRIAAAVFAGDSRSRRSDAHPRDYAPLSAATLETLETLEPTRAIQDCLDETAEMRLPRDTPFRAALQGSADLPLLIARA